jgi:hypothetical protein
MKYLYFIFLVLFVCLLQTTIFAQEKTSQSPTAQILEAKLGTNVQDRQIVGEDSSFAKDIKVYLWFKVSGCASETLSVIWKHGDHSYSAALMIGGSPWRTWAVKTVAISGDWSVSISDSKGTVMKEMSFKVK